MPAEIPRARVQCTGSPLVGHKIAEKIAEKIAKHPLPVTERNSARAVHARQRAAHAAVQCRSFASGIRPRGRSGHAQGQRPKHLNRGATKIPACSEFVMYCLRKEPLLLAAFCLRILQIAAEELSTRSIFSRKRSSSFLMKISTEIGTRILSQKNIIILSQGFLQ